MTTDCLALTFLGAKNVKIIKILYIKDGDQKEVRPSCNGDRFVIKRGNWWVRFDPWVNLNDSFRLREGFDITLTDAARDFDGNSLGGWVVMLWTRDDEDDCISLGADTLQEAIIFAVCEVYGINIEDENDD